MTESMPTIKFAYHFQKLHGQIYGRLVYIGTYCINNATDQDLIKYDTLYPSNHGIDYYKLPEGNYLQLVFIGNKGIPFSTFRTRYKDGKDRLSYYQDNLNKIFNLEVLDESI